VPGLPGWSLPAGHYYGDIKGPARSHGGFYPSERPAIQAIQRRLIAKGYVPGVTDWRSGWADGVFQQPTVDAVARFQRAEMPRTTYFGQVWSDDYRQLAR
jgi:N-acetylmuramoyl-L-alanine amidase